MYRETYLVDVLHDRLEVGESVVILRKRSRGKSDAQKSKDSGSLSGHFVSLGKCSEDETHTVQAGFPEPSGPWG